jgi:hypothetical protein
MINYYIELTYSYNYYILPFICFALYSTSSDKQSIIFLSEFVETTYQIKYPLGVSLSECIEGLYKVL